MLRSCVRMCLRYSSKCYKTYKKFPVSESILNKVGHVNFHKKRFRQRFFSYGLFEINKDTQLLKHLRVTASECWRLRNPINCWSKISCFSLLYSLRYIWILILIYSILTDLLMGCRNFILKNFTKERRDSLNFSGIFALLVMICFSGLIIAGRL